MSTDRTGLERFGAVEPFDHRRRDRRGCEIPAVIVTSYGETGMLILNISAGGLGFTVDPLLPLQPGERISVRQRQLGEARCTVRWGIHPRYGAEFEPPGRTPPGARTLYDSLAPPAG